MASLIDNLFSPLGKEYCSYFYLLTIIGFIFLLLTILSSLMLLLKGKFNVITCIKSLIGPGLFYFTYRLLYSMCLN